MVNSMYYINYFFIMSIFGHFIESFFYTKGNSGILLSYWTPIYGIGTIIILIINKYIKKFKINKILKVFLLFILSALILSFTEVLGGYLIKWIFNKNLWDYSNHKFNIGKYTSLEMSLVWGLSSILFTTLIKPCVDKIIIRIPKIISYMCITLFIIDLITTILIKK